MKQRVTNAKSVQIMQYIPFLGTMPESKSQTASRSVQLFFAQLTTECPYTSQWDVLSPTQNCPFPWGSGPHLYIHFPWAHSSPQPKRHLDRFSRFAGLTTVTDRPK